MNFDIDQLRAFNAVLRLRNFRAAAESLGTPQSSLSQQIGRLEEQVGHRLFERTTRRVEPTPAARALQAYAQSMLVIAEDVRRHFEQPPIDGVLRLGIVEEYALSELHLALGLFRRQFPRFGLALTTGLSAQLTRSLDQGDVDVILAMRLPGRDNGRLLYSRSLVWCGDAQVLGASADGPVPVVTYIEPSNVRTQIVQAFERAGRPFSIVAESPSIAGIQAAVTAGFGITAFSDGFIPHAMPRLSAGSGLPPLDAIEFVVDQRQHPRSGPVEAFAAMLTATATALAGTGTD